MRLIGRPRLMPLYRHVLVAYLMTLIFLYPYGISIGGIASLRAPDVLAALALGLGAISVLMRASLRLHDYLVVGVLPFLILELGTPILGAVGAAQWPAAASTVRMALLWLPALLYFATADRAALNRLDENWRTMLKVGLAANLIYALVQYGVMLNALPRPLLITELLEPWALDRHYRVLDGFRASGFFVNTTALSVFAIVAFAYFYATYIAERRRGDLSYAVIGLLLVLMTTARVAVFASVLILALGWLVLRPGRKLTVALICMGVGGGLAFVVENTVGLDELFYRFTRLFESGVLQDYSLQQRIQIYWPIAMRAADDYPVGTLISAPRILELIDSGYLTYFVQGKWLFVAALGLLLTVLAVRGSLGFFRVSDRRALFLLFLAIYLLIALVTTNPMRSPLMIFALLHGVYMSQRHLRAGRRIALIPGPALAR